MTRSKSKVDLSTQCSQYHYQTLKHYAISLNIPIANVHDRTSLCNKLHEHWDKLPKSTSPTQQSFKSSLSQSNDNQQHVKSSFNEPLPRQDEFIVKLNHQIKQAQAHKDVSDKLFQHTDKRIDDLSEIVKHLQEKASQADFLLKHQTTVAAQSGKEELVNSLRGIAGSIKELVVSNNQQQSHLLASLDRWSTERLKEQNVTLEKLATTIAKTQSQTNNLSMLNQNIPIHELKQWISTQTELLTSWMDKTIKSQQVFYEHQLVAKSNEASARSSLHDVLKVQQQLQDRLEASEARELKRNQEVEQLEKKWMNSLVNWKTSESRRRKMLSTIQRALQQDSTNKQISNLQKQLDEHTFNTKKYADMLHDTKQRLEDEVVRTHEEIMRVNSLLSQTLVSNDQRVLEQQQQIREQQKLAQERLDMELAKLDQFNRLMESQGEIIDQVTQESKGQVNYASQPLYSVTVEDEVESKQEFDHIPFEEVDKVITQSLDVMQKRQSGVVIKTPPFMKKFQEDIKTVKKAIRKGALNPFLLRVQQFSELVVALCGSESCLQSLSIDPELIQIQAEMRKRLITLLETRSDCYESIVQGVKWCVDPFLRQYTNEDEINPQSDTGLMIYKAIDKLLDDLSDDKLMITDMGDALKPVERSNESFETIYGLVNAKATIEQQFLLPLQYPGLFPKISRGLLFWGVPGGGKTLFVKAIANEVGDDAVLFAPSTDAVLSKYQGETERKLTALFAAVTQYLDRPPADLKTKPKYGFIFFDELDNIAGSRTGEGVDTAAATRTVNTLLQLMDGINSDPRVIVIGATNHIKKLDSAILRRLKTRVFLDLPDEEAREMKIIQLLEERYKWPCETNKDAQKVSMNQAKLHGIKPSTDDSLENTKLTSWMYNLNRWSKQMIQNPKNKDRYISVSALNKPNEYKAYESVTSWIKVMVDMTMDMSLDDVATVVQEAMNASASLTLYLLQKNLPHNLLNVAVNAGNNNTKCRYMVLEPGFLKGDDSDDDQMHSKNYWKDRREEIISFNFQLSCFYNVISTFRKSVNMKEVQQMRDYASGKEDSE